MRQLPPLTVTVNERKERERCLMANEWLTACSHSSIMTTLTCPWGGGRRWGRNSWQQETQVWASGKYYKTRPSTLHLNLLFHEHRAWAKENCKVSIEWGCLCWIYDKMQRLIHGWWNWEYTQKRNFSKIHVVE